MDQKETGWFADGEAYENYVGRWSRPIGHMFLDWLSQPRGLRWVDVGCGTGAISEIVLAKADPIQVVGVEPSEGFLGLARASIKDPRAEFRIGDAQSLPLDYAGEMQLMRFFWDTASELFPDAKEKDEGKRFPDCRPEPLADLFRAAALRSVETCALDAPTVFADFDDYWSPFLRGQGPAGAYCISLSKNDRERLRRRLESALPFNEDGTINLIARAWAVRGKT